MIRFESIRLTAAELGPENPLPDIMNNTYIHAGYQMTSAITEEERRNIGKGMLSTMLPYLTQDSYTRERIETNFPAVILENRYLKAVFLPSRGGRLWQLYDKTEKRDLLYVNPVFQPCNLALRNAWFSGGVEFNVGIKGHNPLTCSPLFAVTREDENGNEILSLYEYERIRGVVYSVNVWLPEDSKILYIKTIIENTAPTDTYMYWWSNIAIPQTEDTRVLVPTNRSFVSYYREDHYVLDKTEIPSALGTDVSYPARMHQSLDFFYQIPEGQSKWIAAADRNGKGLLHFSESVLKGRKLFLWGQGNGGRHWGEFLAGAKEHSGEGYIEIQAGLAHTQLEHFLMPGNSEIAFTECYAPLSGNPDAIHGEWDASCAEIENVLYKYTEGRTPDRFLENRFPALKTMRTTKVLFRGSGWGALENEVRGICGLAPISLYFTEWVNPGCKESDPWQMLLHIGSFPKMPMNEAPVSYITDTACAGQFWEDRLCTACSAYPEDSRYSLQYGVTLYAKGKKEDAERYWKLAAQQGNPFAWRNLSAYHANELRDYQTAADEILYAVKLLPDDRFLSIDCASILCASDDPVLMRKFLAVSETFSETIQQLPRMRLYRVRALLALNLPKEAMTILTPDFTMPDIKEGELSVSALWKKMHILYLMKYENRSESEAEQLAEVRYPLPYSLDFRMHP